MLLRVASVGFTSDHLPVWS